MIQSERIPTMLLRTTAVLLTILLTFPARAQTSKAEPVLESSLLRAELSSTRTLFYPSDPITFRFTLFNPTDAPIDIPVLCNTGTAHNIMLPRSVVLGTTTQPALSVLYENEPPIALSPEATAADEFQDTLRLGPRASVGVEFDLAKLNRQFRYSGDYRLEWRPLAGTLAPAKLSFRVEPRKDAVLVTDYGKITFRLAYDQAPHNIENFLELVRDGFYDGKTIHRLIPGFILQGGSPDATAKGIRPDGKMIKAEFSDTPFELGTLAMAHKPKDDDSASCQFFVSLGHLPELNGKYSVIGQAADEESLRTLQVLAALPTNNQGRPTRPLSIRFFTLVDVPTTGARELELNER